MNIVQHVPLQIDEKFLYAVAAPSDQFLGNIPFFLLEELLRKQLYHEIFDN